MSAADIQQALRERITTQALPPGSKLSENDLAAEFDVPRSRVREAIGVLEQRGLVRRNPNRGAIVQRLELTQVFEIYAVREMLEALCARLATQNVPPESWQDLVELYDAPLEDSVRRGDMEAYVAALETFRRRSVDAAGNPVLRDMLDSIHDKTRAIIRRICILPGRAQQGLQEHRAVLAAMRRGDADAAERLKRDNIRSAVEWLRRYQSFVL